jgi:hypothetical protein
MPFGLLIFDAALVDIHRIDGICPLAKRY